MFRGALYPKDGKASLKLMQYGLQVVDHQCYNLGDDDDEEDDTYDGEHGDYEHGALTDYSGKSINMDWEQVPPKASIHGVLLRCEETNQPPDIP